MYNYGRYINSSGISGETWLALRLPETYTSFVRNAWKEEAIFWSQIKRWADIINP